MMRSGFAAMAGIAAVTLSMTLIVPAGTTGANWREDLTVSIDDATSDSIEMSVANSTNGVDHSQSAPADVANEPAITVTNESARQQSWIDVVSTRVTVPASNTTSTLLNDVNIDYDISASCLTGLNDPAYWTVSGGVGGATNGTTYTRTPAGPVAGDVLEPGQGRSLCPWVRPGDDTATATGRRDFLLAHAGRQLDIATVVRQKSHAPATWTSSSSTVNTRYEVKLPPPTRPSSDGVVCARTLVGGSRSGAGLFGRLYWAWPFAGDSSSVATPAVDRFVLLRSTDGKIWTEFRESLDQSYGDLYETGGDERESQSINSNHLANNSATPVYLSVRAYLYAGSSVHVDADWMVQVSEGDLQISDYFSCRTGGSLTDTSPGVTNPNSAPVGLD